MTRARYRWRTRLRRHTPWLLLRIGVFAKGEQDCGAHEWYREERSQWRCYHCEAGSCTVPTDA